MEKVFNYSYLKDDESIDSQLLADNMGDAYTKLGDIGIEPYALKMDLRKTISLSKNLPQRELARFYETMGKRLKNGNQFLSGLESAIEFTKDIRLKASISTLHSAISEGRGIGESMESAGFPIRHSKAIGAMEESGQAADTFLSLSDECNRENNMRTKLVSLTRMPKVFASVVIIMFYGAFGFLSPLMLGKMADIVGYDKMPNYAREYYDFVVLFSENLVISSILYFGFFIGIFLLGKSKIMKDVLDRVKILHQISERGDMASLWLRYGLMFSAAMNVQEAAVLVSSSAKRDDSKESFIALESYLQSGYQFSEAVKMSGFPEYVVNSIRSGESSDGLGDSMLSLSQELFEDVDMLINQLTDTLQTIVVLSMGIVVVLFFLLTYYPLLSTIMSQV